MKCNITWNLSTLRTKKWSNVEFRCGLLGFLFHDFRIRSMIHKVTSGFDPSTSSVLLPFLYSSLNVNLLHSTVRSVSHEGFSALKLAALSRRESAVWDSDVIVTVVPMVRFGIAQKSVDKRGPLVNLMNYCNSIYLGYKGAVGTTVI